MIKFIVYLLLVSTVSYANPEPVSSLPSEKLIKLVVGLRKNPTIHYSDADIEKLSNYHYSEFFDLLYILLEKQLANYVENPPLEVQKIRIIYLISLLEKMGRPSAVFLDSGSSIRKVDIALRFERLIDKYGDLNLDTDILVALYNTRIVIKNKKKPFLFLPPLNVYAKFHYPLPDEFRVPVLFQAPLPAIQPKYDLTLGEIPVEIQYLADSSYRLKPDVDFLIALRGTFNHTRGRLISMGFDPKVVEEYLTSRHYEQKRRKQCASIFTAN